MRFTSLIVIRVAQSVEPFRRDVVRTQGLWWRAGVRPRGDRLPPVLRRDRPCSRMPRAGASRPGADALMGSLANGPRDARGPRPEARLAGRRAAPLPGGGPDPAIGREYPDGGGPG